MKVGIGQDSHRFSNDPKKPYVIGGIVIENVPGMDADSDGDIILHALCNAITSITHVPILGRIAIDMCKKQGITDSKEYLKKALETLNGYAIEHIAFTVEAGRPKLQPHAEKIRASVASLCNIPVESIGFSCTSGDGMTTFAEGIGAQCFCILTVKSSI